ncbi:hypothetical protein K438DRAFT_1822115 [Mycena galopus ATCC 62051]|nr:hypothetical protein K438DRAFT_1822115 [Mycena galopus ATCC 62051]
MAQTTSYQCPDCPRSFTTGKGRQRHRNSAHRQFTPASEGEDNHAHTKHYHPKLTGRPCNRRGQYLPPFTPPPPSAHLDAQPPGSWHPFHDRTEFDFAHFHFVEVQSSAAQINTALDQWTAQVLQFGHTAPWSSAEDLYKTIDDIQHGDAPWKVYKLRYTGPRPDGLPPKWMTQEYDLCARDCRTILHHQLATPEFRDKINYSPYRQFDGRGRRVWSNLMSGDWVWKQADLIAQNESTHGAMFVPVVAGSDKTTVSVATGHQEYHPVYVSPGVLTGIARRAHGNGVLPAAFLPIPKTSKKHRKKPAYQHFVRQMYHACLARVFEPLRTAMTTPEVVRCADGHFRRVIYGLGPYIADYPEQVWLSCIVQNWCPKCDAKPDNLDAPGARRRKDTKTAFLVTCFDPGTLWDDFGIRSDVIPFTRHFPRADIHEMLSPDLLHQVIKGTFKDHLVEWVNQYLHTTYGEARALEIIADIDHRISAVPSFPGLRRFPDGRDFSQWTGDDSKALMKVYLAAIAGYVPPEMVKTVAAFMDFCYLVRRNAINSDTLVEIKAALDRFHTHRDIFVQTGVRVDISLPRQHSLLHYLPSIRLFGSPNGLCSSITESKHIKAALFVARAYPPRLAELAIHIQQPEFPELVRRFLYEQLHPDSDVDARDIPIADCPRFDGRIKIYHSATARFYAPSDLCGAGGMRRERIRSNPQWHGAYPRRDTVFINVDAELPGMLGMIIGRVYLFFSFTYRDTHYPCALVQWFPRHAPMRDDVTGLWVVTPEAYRNGQKCLAVIHLDSIARAAHLLPVYGASSLPENFHYSYSLDAFRAFFVNSYADHHVHEFLYS